VRERARSRFNHFQMIDEYLQAYEAMLGGCGDEPALLSPAGKVLRGRKT